MSRKRCLQMKKDLQKYLQEKNSGMIDNLKRDLPSIIVDNTLVERLKKGRETMEEPLLHKTLVSLVENLFNFNKTV